ncbi:MAG: hypothetical protein PHY23_05325 [Oscillospiraceae bacterium]|nr:hypothetical protein [Oscillospiraceae bacterium]
MEELKHAFYGVMYKYEKSFSETGVMANLSEWKKQKANLIDLLRRHPNWNEQALAVVFDYAEGRNIDSDIVDEVCYTLSELADEVIPANRQRVFHTALNAAVSEYSQTLSPEKLEIVRTSGGIKCVEGQKSSRIIGKLCKTFGVDKHTRYNAVFAQLADALNPLQMQKTVLLSVHPCDFLEMSNKDSTWNSCHKLSGGSYQAGCLSYMTDSVSMVLYTVDSDVKKDFHKVPRRNRQMFFYHDGQLIQSRLYPDSSNELTEQYRSIVQNAIARCLGVPDLWTFKVKREDINESYETVPGSRQYADYSFQGNLSILKATKPTEKIRIGHPSLCVCCGRPYGSGALKCNCEELVVCQDCGRTVPKDSTRYLDGVYYCSACLHICAACGRVTTDTMYPAFNRRGHLREVCFDCYQTTIAPCAECGVHTICATIGGTLCPRTALDAA